MATCGPAETEPQPQNWLEIVTHLRKLGLSREGIEYIRATAVVPARSVQGNRALNVVSGRPSLKSSCVIQTESSTIERPFLIDSEYDDECLFIWDQPMAVHYDATRVDGRAYRRRYTGDFLRVERKRVAVYELKSRDDFDKLVADPASGWALNDGKYCNEGIKREFSELGIYFDVRTNEDLNLLRAENLHLLMHSRRDGVPEPADAYVKRVLSLLKKNGAMTLNSLAAEMGSLDVTPLLRLIDRGLVFSDLDQQRLGLADCCYVAATRSAVRNVVAGLDLFLKVSGDTGVTADQAPTPSKAVRIGARLDDLAKGSKLKDKLRELGEIGELTHKGLKALRLDIDLPERSARTHRRWRKIAREKGTLGLGGQTEQCGAKGSRLHKRHDELISRLHRVHMARKTKRTLSSTFKVYKFRHKRRKEKKCRGFSGRPVVLETFRLKGLQSNARDVAYARGGRRLANAKSPPTDPGSRSLIAVRPFERAHIDHYLADLFLYVVYSGGFAYALRPWVSFLIDEATKLILGFTMTLGAPSRRSIARVLRDCVRRWGRLPEGILSDWGADFQSNYSREFFARSLIEKFVRPTAAGRWGQVVERAFGIYKTECLSYLEGNTAEVIDRRSLSSEYQPHNQAQLSLRQGFRITEAFTQDWMNTHARGLSTVAPSILMSEGLAKYTCSGVPEKLDQAFLINTSPPRGDGRFKLDPVHGIYTQRQYYTGDALSGIHRSHISGVVPDCEDDTLVYVLIGSTWNALRSGQWRKQFGMDRESVIAMTIRRQEAKEAVAAARDDGDADLGRFLMVRTRDAAPAPASSQGTAKGEAAAMAAAAPTALPDEVPEFVED